MRCTRSATIWGLVLGAACLFGCASKADLEGSVIAETKGLEDRINSVVEHPVRADRAMNAQRKIWDVTRGFFGDLEEAQAEVVRLNRSHDTSRWAFERVSVGLSKKRRQAGKKLVDAAMEMRRALTEEEWKALMDR